MSQRPPACLVELGGTRNCRDIGGYRAANGRTVRHGLLFRSDLPVGSDAGRHADPLALQLVVDLREPEERGTARHALEGRARRVLAKPFGLGPIVAADPTKARTLGTLYESAIRELGPSIAEIIGELCRPGALPALVHCTAGKDRTGIVIGLVLSLLGVADADVAREYAITDANLDAAFFERINVHGHAVQLTRLMGAEESEMLRVLHLVRTISGDVDSYLVSHGLRRHELDHLRASLLTDP